MANSRYEGDHLFQICKSNDFNSFVDGVIKLPWVDNEEFFQGDVFAGSNHRTGFSWGVTHFEFESESPTWLFNYEIYFGATLDRV